MYKNGFYSHDDLLDILSQIRTIVSDYKERKHDMLPEDVISYRDDLSVLRTQLGDIEGDLFDDKLGSELEYESYVLSKTEEFVNDFNSMSKKVPYAEDTAKRRAKLEAKPLAVEMNKAKSSHRKAYVLVQHTLQDVLNAMSSRISFLLKGTPVTSDGKNRPIYEDSYTKHWGHISDSETDKALDQLERLEDEL